MFAVFETGGKQYKVSEGDIIFVEKLGVEEGEKVTSTVSLLSPAVRIPLSALRISTAQRSRRML